MASSYSCLLSQHWAARVFYTLPSSVCLTNSLRVCLLHETDSLMYKPCLTYDGCKKRKDRIIIHTVSKKNRTPLRLLIFFPKLRILKPNFTGLNVNHTYV